MTEFKRTTQGARWRIALAAMALVAVTATVTTRVVSEEKGDQPKMSPEEQKMMEARIKATSPGEHHKHLMKLVGTWSAKAKFWMRPDDKPNEGQGTATWKSIMGGRYVMLNYDGNSAAMGPFQGISITGYDNITKQYTDVWVDSMSTAPFISHGTCDASGKTFQYKGEFIDPMTGKKSANRSVMRMVSDTEMRFDVYDFGPDGKEFQSLEITYTKK
ncbi:MAG: DUF1579 domain-containing protein [Planctomycetes bacterium]|nr:DUF1579 domain-containing protein [Planctomycetota bacterium]